MKKFLEKVLPENTLILKAIAVIVTVCISLPLTWWIIYVLGVYGITLFLLIPVLIGVSSTTIVGLKKEINKKEAWNIGFITLCAFSLVLFIMAFDGIICMIMAAPIGLLLTKIGTLLGCLIARKTPGNGPVSILILLIFIPSAAFMEKESQPSLSKVVTSVEITADAEAVWKNVVEFPELKEPDELLFKAGIAYPVNAKIDGKGVGAVRYCNFNTGSFVEPITAWDQPYLLAFDVAEQPEPMEEISFWDINAPHLHEYFVSKKGQFRIIRLPNGNTLLEGTTWYYHNIRPEFYWRIWSNYIIHQIHKRVLNHIKKNAEASLNSK